MPVNDKANEPTLTLTRVLNAPPETVFKAWYEPAHMKQWFAPDGFTVPRCEIDLRPGGTILFSMQNPDWNNGRESFSKGTFREVERNKRTVSVVHFSDENGNRVKPSFYGLSEDFPEEMVMTVTFEPADGGKKTKLTVTQSVPLSIAERNGALIGWGQTLAHLEQYLTTLI
ncbi:MAG TPA: SRPBCC domain-containing protein [Candidatus Rubrimentiphilum sp.]|nr:SRPBCC domain-containing protein [Candidatus Rubrimentiphilum sp.]